MKKKFSRPAGNGFAWLALFIAITFVFLSLWYGSTVYAAFGIVLHLWCLALNERAQYRNTIERSNRAPSIANQGRIPDPFIQPEKPVEGAGERRAATFLSKELETLDGIRLPDNEHAAKY